jgi:hypothetical protein
MELDYNQTYKFCIIAAFLTNLTKILNFSIKEVKVKAWPGQALGAPEG